MQHFTTILSSCPSLKEIYLCVGRCWASSAQPLNNLAQLLSRDVSRGQQIVGHVPEDCHGIGPGGSLTWMPILQSTGPSVYHKFTLTVPLDCCTM